MPGTKYPVLPSHAQILNRDREHSPETVKALEGLQQCIDTLKNIIDKQKTWLSIQSTAALRGLITEQVNLLTSIICKTLPKGSLIFFTDQIYAAQKAVLNAYLCSTARGKEHTFLGAELLKLNISKIEWGELIASLQSINHWPHRALPFVEGLLSPFDVPVFDPKPVPPSSWSVFKSALKAMVLYMVKFFQGCQKIIQESGKSALQKTRTVMHDGGNLLNDWGRNIKTFCKSKHQQFKKWREKPIPPIMTPDGYYVAPPIDDQKPPSTFWLYFGAVKEDIRESAHHMVDEAIQQFTTPTPQEVSYGREPGKPVDYRSSRHN